MVTHTLGLIRLWRIPKGSSTPRRKYGSISRRVYKDSDTPYIPQCQQSELGLKKIGPGEVCMGFPYPLPPRPPPRAPANDVVVVQGVCSAVRCGAVPQSDFDDTFIVSGCSSGSSPVLPILNHFNFDRSVHSSMWSRLWPVARLALFTDTRLGLEPCASRVCLLAGPLDLER